MENRQLAFDWTKVSEVELVYKSKVKPGDRPSVKSSKEAYKLLQKLWNDNTMELREEFKILLLNRANKVLGVYELSKGGLTGTVADPRMIFTAALKGNAVSIMLAHNHPSGNLEPSRADKEMTAKIVEAGRFLDIQVLDHLIITADSYLSFADEGLL